MPKAKFTSCSCMKQNAQNLQMWKAYFEKEREVFEILSQKHQEVRDCNMDAEKIRQLVISAPDGPCVSGTIQAEQIQNSKVYYVEKKLYQEKALDLQTWNEWLENEGMERLTFEAEYDPALKNAIKDPEKLRNLFMYS